MKVKRYRLLCLILSLLFSSVGCKKQTTGTPEELCQAARTGDIERIRSLIKNGIGADVRIMNDWTPLHEAAVHGHKHIVDLLITKGADVNTIGMDGDTALLAALRNADEYLAELLITYGSDVNVLTWPPRSTGLPVVMTHEPIHFASRFGFEDIVKLNHI